MTARAQKFRWPMTLRKCFSVSSQAEATHRSSISAVRQRVTLLVRFCTPLCCAAWSHLPVALEQTPAQRNGPPAFSDHTVGASALYRLIAIFTMVS